MASATSSASHRDGRSIRHDALEFWEFAHHERTEIGLREERGAFGVSAVCTDQIGELARHRLHAQHALGLRAKLVVVDDMLEPSTRLSSVSRRS